MTQELSAAHVTTEELRQRCLYHAEEALKARWLYRDEVYDSYVLGKAPRYPE